MSKSFFADADAGLIGLLFFFTFFCGVLIWIFRPGAKDYFKKQGDIPLKDEE